jgi:hypothetical protein
MHVLIAAKVTQHLQFVLTSLNVVQSKLPSITKIFYCLS